MNKYSINPNSGDKILIPDILDDKTSIDNFLKINQNKKIVVVQGLGFVGAVMSLVCANAINGEYAVIGVDLANESNYWKIKSLNDGVFPIIASDPKIEEYFIKSKKKNNFYATYDPYAYSLADVIIIDINLDVQMFSDSKGNLNSFDVNLNMFKTAINTVGNNCREDVLILVETTVPPGTCLKVIEPIIDDCLKNRNLQKKYFLGHSYERVIPGPEYIDSIQNFYRVYSGINDVSADKVEEFLKTIISTKKYPLTRLVNTNATEMAKVLENSYRAMNIAFITEWSRFAEEANVNLFEIVDAIRMRPTHSNMMYPGIGVGGYCLTKDPLLASWSKVNLFNSDSPLNQCVSSVKINDLMPSYAFDYLKNFLELKSLNNLKILLLGVSYKGDVADTRYTPVEKFYNFCIKENADLYLHDPYVKYWEELNLEVNSSLDKLMNIDFDVIVISTSHTIYKNKEFLKKFTGGKETILYDTLGILDESTIEDLSSSFVMRVLGRGDIT